MTDNRTTERVDHLPRVREAIDELMRKKDVTDNRTTELKPCPFCGGEAVLHPTYDMDTGAVDGWFAWCDNDTCECKPETGQFFTEAGAIEAWNSRAERTCFADEVTHRDCKYSVNRGWRERTCKFTIEDNMNETEGMGDVWIECSTCHCVFDYYADEWLMKMSYCPNCGARVVE